MVYLAYTAGCSASSWPWCVAYLPGKKNGRGRANCEANPTRGTLVCSLCIPFIDHLSGDTSGFTCGTCELCYLDYELC